VSPAFPASPLLIMRSMDMKASPRWRRRWLAFMLALAQFVAAGLTRAQQGGATGEPLKVLTSNLPKAYVRQVYKTVLVARGGVLPLKWELTDGALPAGLSLRRDGTLTGTPTDTGQFRFTVKVTDSGKPEYERKQDLVLLVVAPLLAQWGRYPAVNGQRIEGSVKVSNQTERDFDLTVIVLAVNENGRATAIGYQHFELKKNASDFEIPFGENLAHGAYQLNLDAVAEVAATNSIYRARLVPKEKFHVQQGP
jgi:hypothetical protein